MIGATRFARLNPQVFTVRFRTLGGERLSLSISDNNTPIARTDIAVGFRARAATTNRTRRRPKPPAATAENKSAAAADATNARMMRCSISKNIVNPVGPTRSAWPVPPSPPHRRGDLIGPGKSVHVQTDAFNRQNLKTGISEITLPAAGNVRSPTAARTLGGLGSYQGIIERDVEMVFYGAITKSRSTDWVDIEPLLQAGGWPP